MLAALSVATACDGPRPSPEERAVTDAALTELYRVRERAGGVVFWADRATPGPVFTALAGVADDATLVPPPDAAPAPLERDTATLADLEALFRASPDGWRAFRLRYPFYAGLIEVGPVTRPDDSTAAVLIGRSCGEHCRFATRVHVRGGRVVRLESLDLPMGR